MAASAQPNSASPQPAEAQIARLQDELAQKATDIYRTLFETIDEGFALLELLFDPHGQVADLIYREVNPAFKQHSGLSDAIGKRASEVFPHTEPSWFAALSRVHQTGVAERTEGFNTDTQRWLTAHYSRVGEVGSPYIVAVFQDITERKAAETARRVSQERQAFLLQLSDALRPLADTTDIQRVAMQLVGQHLGANRVAYADVSPDEQTYLMRDNYVTQGFPKMTGRFPVSTFGSASDKLKAGQNIVLTNVATEADLTDADKANFLAVNCQSGLGIPLLKQGRLVAVFAVHQGVPRQWREDEMTLLAETADRIWAASERAKAEAALRQSEEQFRLLSIASSDSIYTMSPDWTQMRQLMGKSFLANTDRPSASWLETYIPATEQAYVQQIIQQAIDSKSFFELEHRVIRADGSIGWTFSRAIPMIDEQGSIQQWLGAASDITARKAALTALHRSEARQRAILDSAKDYAIFTTDLHQRVTSWNPGAQFLFGYSEEDILHQPLDWLYNEQDRQAKVPQLESQQAIETGRFDNERWHSRQDGSLFYGSGVVTPLRDEQGEIIGLLKVMRDLTVQKQAEQALLEADRRKDEFLAMLAHELRNPLTPIRGGLQVLKMTHQADPTLSALLPAMNRQVDHLIRMLDDLLDVSRISRGKIELHPQRMDLTQVVAQAVEAAAGGYQTAGRQLHVTLPNRALDIDGDATRLHQVVTNLLTNGLRYTREGGQVWLSLEAVDQEAVLRVRDNGIGLAVEQLKPIFELFVQVDTALARSNSGLGLGLSLVQQLVSLHGGRVEAFSPGLDQGSEFVIHLPLLSA